MNEKTLLEKIHEAEGRDKITAMLDYSRFMIKKKPEVGIVYARKALHAFEEEQDDRGVISAYVHLAYALFYANQFDESLICSEKIVELGEKNMIAEATATGYNIRGNIYNRLNKYSLAISSLLHAVNIHEKNNNQLELVSCYNNLGSVHMRTNDLKAAEDYFQLARQIAREEKHPALYSIKINLASVLVKREKYKEAQSIYQLLIKYFKDKEMLPELATIYRNLAITCTALGLHDEAYANLTEAQQLSIELNDHKLLLMIYSDLIELFVAQKDFTRAGSYIDEAKKLAEESDMRWESIHLYKIIIVFYEQQDDLKNANLALHKLNDLMQEHHKEIDDKRTAELETKYKTRIFRTQTTKLNAKNQLMEKQIKDLKIAQDKLKSAHAKLNSEFQQTVDKLNTQDDLLARHSRMAVMGRMVSAIAHQWRQPLNVIAVLAQAMEDAWDYGELSEEYLKSQIGFILDQVDYMNNTITDFRNFFKPDMLKKFNISETIQKTLELTNYMINKHHITLTTNLDENCFLMGNPNELIQVVISIINNAVQTLEEDNHKEPLIEINQTCENGSHQIEIYNNGRQIPEEVLEKIFKPYFSTRGEKGTGIGLYICQMLVENKFKGKLWVENKETGVSFKILIPASENNLE